MNISSKIVRRFSVAQPTKQKVRVRFAPSPTGLLHLGGLRTALFNYLFAKKNKGQFILRIEDTDQKRLVPESVQNIVDNLNYFQLQWDEGPGAQGKNNLTDYENHGQYGPYYQSKRIPIYQKYMKELLQNGDAYYCFCCAERLEKVRSEQLSRKEIPKYDGHCRNLTNEQIRTKVLNKERFTIRLKVNEGETSFTDIIHGKITINHSQVEDQILMKSDGYPTYHLANVIDDYTMKISHVIRGQEWITSTPKHLLIYESLNIKPPTFAHIPLLVKKGGGKLSKRDQNSSVDILRETGFLPEAVNNFTALLGWYPRYLEDNQKLDNKFSLKQEVLDMAELASLFSLERVNGSDSQVDDKKLLFLNGQHIKRRFNDMLTDDSQKTEFISQVLPYLSDNAKETLRNWSEEKRVMFCEIVMDRMQLFSDAKEFAYLFSEPSFTSESSIKSIAKLVKDAAKSRQTLTDLNAIFEELHKSRKFTIESINKALSEYLFERSTTLKNEDVYHLMRLALSGSHQGPPSAVIAYLLDYKTTSQRFTHFVNQVIPIEIHSA